MDLPKHDKHHVIPLPDSWQTPPTGRVLCFAPHPDDECAGPGGALHKHRVQGDDVRIVIATDGRMGDPEQKFDAATYVELRRDESLRAMAILDCHDLRFWNLPDSCVITDADIGGLALRVVDEVREFDADIVYAPWEGEANSDHRAIYCGVLRGLRSISFAGQAFGYELWGLMVPDAVLDISDVFDKKMAAMREYESQLAYVDYLHTVTGQNAHRSVIFNQGKGYAEAFRRIDIRS